MVTEVLWKSPQKKINGKTKPFIDDHLQLQIPDLDQVSPSDLELKKRSIFSHYYRDSNPTINELTHLEAELNASILEAKQSHEAWKKMLTKLEKVTKEIRR